VKEGTPTGIKRQDLGGRMGVKYAGERAQVVHYGSDAHGLMDRIVLGFGDRHIALYGYFEAGEFMEVDHELLD
jgi:hypothetical protein